MSQLIAMRQRIKAVRTIQKITRAMCLVSMSMHTRMRPKRLLIENYSSTLSQWLAKLHALHTQELQHNASHRELIIIVGAQRGLCGVLAQNIMHATQLYCAQHKNPKEVIYIGIHGADYAHISHDYHEYKPFLLPSVGTTAERLTMHILTHKKNYATVKIIACEAKNFFSQTPVVHQVIPYTHAPTSDNALDIDEYIWEQTPQELIDSLTNQALQASIYTILFQSFMAEQAARFIAMDSATRNADNLLVTMRLNYNKLRQAKITKELTDLIGSFF